MKTEINLEMINEAKSKIREFILEFTPIVRSETLSNLRKRDFYLKLENLQVTNSFKIRGAANKLLDLISSSSTKSEKGIIATSAGNHGQAVALCAEKLGFRSRIVVPETTPKIKVNKIRQYEVELILHGRTYDEAEQYARDLAVREGLDYISPYNDPQVIAGQGTVALEILSQVKDVDTIIVPVGGGGLISGVGVAVKSINPRVQIIGVQSEASPAMFESLRLGNQVDAKVEDSIADGLSGNIEPGSMTFEIARYSVDKMVLVSEESIRKAIRLLWEKEGQIVEGSGAAPVAAILENKITTTEGDRLVVIISGGNIDFDMLKRIIGQ